MLKQPAAGQPLYLTTKEVADLLRVKERKVYDLAAADEIPHRRITGKLLFPARELHAWLDGTHGSAAERPNLLAGSHDPLLDWAIHASGCGLASLCNGSADGLRQFEAGTAALAGLHLPEDGARPGETGWNVETVGSRHLQNAVLIRWATRKRGLLIAEDQAGAIRSVADLKGRRVALRQSGAGTALLFSRLLGQAGLSETDLVCAASPAHTENEAAAAVAGGEAEAALGLKTMAKPFRLAFLPLIDEPFDLLIDRKAYFTEPLQRLFDFARTKEFAARAAALGGYDLARHGTVQWLSS